MSAHVSSAVSSAEPVHSTALLVDVLGELHRAGVRETRLKELVGLGEDLGVPGPTVRVTLARLRERGWFEVNREGRESVYRLTDGGLRVLAAGGARIFRPSPEPWGGAWAMVVYTVPESDRATRDELRRQLAWLGFSSLAPATWICPHPRLEEVAETAATLPSARVTPLTVRTAGLAEDRALAERCWDLSEVAAGYGRFITDLRLRAPGFRRLQGRDAFVARVRLVHDYQLVTRRDPRFPAELQRPGWPGDEAHRMFDRTHALLERASPDPSTFITTLTGDV